MDFLSERRPHKRDRYVHIVLTKEEPRICSACFYKGEFFDTRSLRFVRESFVSGEYSSWGLIV